MQLCTQKQRKVADCVDTNTGIWLCLFSLNSCCFFSSRLESSCFHFRSRVRKHKERNACKQSEGGCASCIVPNASSQFRVFKEILIKHDKVGVYPCLSLQKVTDVCLLVLKHMWAQSLQRSVLHEACCSRRRRALIMPFHACWDGERPSGPSRWFWRLVLKNVENIFVWSHSFLEGGQSISKRSTCCFLICVILSEQKQKYLRSA